MPKSWSEAAQTGYWAGVDVSKEVFDVAVAAPDWKGTLADLPARVFSRTPEGVDECIAWLDTLTEGAPEGAAVRCVMEATGRYSVELAAWMMEGRPGLAPAIEPPRQTAAFITSMGLRNVTDKLAARCLAVYGLERRPKPYEPPSPEELELREVCRYRDSLVCERTAVKNQAGETTTSAFVERNRQKRLRLLDADIERTETEMRHLVNQGALLNRDVALLGGIYGVGFLTAVVIRTELGDLRRFDKARQLSAFAGLSPSIHQSGTSVCKKTRMCKRGNPRVRQALYLSSMVAIQGHNDLQRTYAQLLNNGKTPMAALGAVMRKLLTVMRAVLISERPYQPDWKLSGKLT